MKKFLLFASLIGALCLSFSSMRAAEAAKKLTCCQEAKAKDKECTHKCCIAAHKKDESCTRCNPDKQDLAKKVTKKTDKSSQ
jgi:hypothetical protein